MIILILIIMERPTGEYAERALPNPQQPRDEGIHRLLQRSAVEALSPHNLSDK